MILGLGVPINLKLFLNVFYLIIHPAAHICPPPLNYYPIHKAKGYYKYLDDLNDNFLYLPLLFIIIAKFLYPIFTDIYDNISPKSLIIDLFVGSVPKHFIPLYLPIYILYIYLY